jgi:predicted DNA-binding protein
MKKYVHARLDPETRARLDELTKATGETESALVKKGLRLVHEQLRSRQSALDLAADLVGKYRGRIKDLSTNKKHLDDLGR